MITVLHRDRGDAANPCLPKGNLRGEAGYHLTEGLAPIHVDGESPLGDDRRLRRRLQESPLPPFVVLGETEYAVGGIPTQVRLHERTGNVLGIVRASTHALAGAGDECLKGAGVQGLHGSLLSRR
ncbi:MAG: hypothetical protein A2Z31_03820 [candidate division NC10 bacterium RBG_16_65_8]|nr:MAG: hypothetical protein A2Z31_03820 [candidate division NC10 bacterium RBG_16_65_8]